MDKNKMLVQSIEEHAVRIDAYDDLDTIVNAAANKRYVLLGEASHGTSEFYTMRAELSKRLIKDYGFSFIAVEGDWPSCFTVNQYIKGYSKADAYTALKDFDRWPSWMWANEEILELVKWLKTYNETAKSKTGFYGLDVYSLWESMEEIIRQLENISPADVESAKQAFSCFEPFERRGENYAISSAYYGEDCTEEVIKVLIDLQKKRKHYPKEQEGDLNLEVNSLVMLDAERYYRAMARGGAEDWNIRDTHMVTALEKVMDAHGEDAKAIIWEHNTHIGDARATDMAEEGMVNVGQILREKYGEQVYAIGFGTHHGTVIASDQWGGTVEVMDVPLAEAGSWEDALHQAGEFDKYILFNKKNEEAFSNVVGHRAIGVVYDPDLEHLGNYVPSRIAQRYDAFIFINQTSALIPLFK
ncbi:erythromycin esterase family protein [Bacillus sp. ISL-35]|uniref:erythromycin esterase family protein n=1 Tax=Bacillus sp. ISL-35 TaxID=2819122 RepID=UPI001BEC55A7|nr:erythromycin esterase family protein [Bacillus sp. ISL-35]MBT2679537.1 erythromycin esterase family protein [Bacillus sp. ISL-35]MBT2703440.1 erythromycin esterase family protein [Chryseobacterium sp. ISL-80]